MSKFPYQWDLSPLYSGPDDPAIERDMAAAEKAVKAFAGRWADRQDYLTDPLVLRQALDELEVLERSHGTGDKPLYFLQLGRVLDQNDQHLKSAVSRLEPREAANRNELMFFGLKLGQITPAKQTEFLNHPKLRPFSYFLQRRFSSSRFDLSDQTEQMLNLVSPLATSRWSDMVEEFVAAESRPVLNAAGQTETVAFNGMRSLLSSADASVRDSVGRAASDVLAGVAPVAEQEINAFITAITRQTKFRGYQRPDASRYQRDGLQPEVVDVMLETVAANFELSQRFYKFKAKLLGKTRLKYWDRTAAYGQLPSGFTPDSAAALVRQVLAEVDSDFADHFDQALAKGRVDFLPRTGKSGGAACWHSLITLPTYFFLNFTGQLNDVITLGHEFGHYLNNLYMQKDRDALSFGVVTPLAEVASTFTEAFVLQRLLAEADPETKLALLVANLENELSNIFRQTAAMKLEQELYRRIEAEGFLSHQQVGGIFLKHMSAYMGPAIEMTAGAENWWINWGHLRMVFYDYSYTFAKLVAMALHAKFDQDPAFIADIKGFLGAGTSLSPSDLLAQMGLDISKPAFWQSGIDRWSAQFKQAEALARQIGKLPS